ncbi:MAG: histidinol-phosphate transaminase [Chloroflexota bacterium]|nr:histidinol-phosphate transaminase [Chloroflexota bacterium]
MVPPEEGVQRMIRADLLRLTAYQPIEPPDVLGEKTGIPVEGVIKLDGNENPYGCSPRVSEALAAYRSYNIYPDPEQREVRQALQEYVGLGAEHILAGAGSDEVIDLVLRLFVSPGDRVVNCVPTFGMYSFCTEVCGGEVVEVPRDAAFAVDIARVRESLDAGTKVVFVASPNNPTGNITPEPDILELVETGVVVVVDEAYHEFSDVTVAHLVPQHDNLIVLRTFSKWAGLAGLRVGYGILPSSLVPYLLKIKQPYNVNVAAQIAVRESLADIDRLRATVKAIVEERGRLFDRLSDLAFLRPWPSEANFIYCEVTAGDARTIHSELQKRGIFIRYFDTPLLRNSIRISVGKPEHTDAVIAALSEIGGQGSG